MKKKGNVFRIIFGILYLVLSGLAFFNAVYYQTPYNFFWFCYAGMFIIGLGILFKNSALIKSQLYILFIPDAIWIVDFISYIATGGNSFFGITNYFFLPAPLLSKIVTLQHLFTVPIALYYAYKVKSESKYVFLVSYLQLFLVFFFTRVFTTVEQNINCAYTFCGDLSFSVSPYLYLIIWFIGGIVMIYLSYIIIDKTFSAKN